MPDFFVRKRNISNFATTWLIRRSYPLFITLFWRLCASLQMYDNMWRKNGRFFAAKKWRDAPRCRDAACCVRIQCPHFL